MMIYSEKTFTNSVETVIAFDNEGVKNAFRRLEELKNNLHIVGYIRYETKDVFLGKKIKSKLPLMYFECFKNYEKFSAPQNPPQVFLKLKPEISYEDFDKLQFRVGKIISCEEVKKSKKLLCSQVQIGSQVKQIVSGIKQHYSAEEMVGKKVMVLVNLKPATLAGVVSEGMLLCAEDEEGNLALLTPEKDMPPGAEIC